MGHWYDSKTGSPKHTVVNKTKGGDRPTTLRDARHLKLVPSVSGILDLLAKPGLDEWKIKQILNAVVEWQYTPDLDIEKWKTNIRQIASQESTQAADRGRLVHGSLEGYYINGRVEAEEIYQKVVEEAVIFMNKTFKNVKWTPEKTFAFNGYGGTCDLSSDEGNGIILDFKTKDTNDPKKMQAYMSHAMQLAAYRHGLGLPKAKCYNLFISVQKPGLLVLKEWKEDEIIRAYNMFECLLNYWYLSNSMEKVL